MFLPQRVILCQMFLFLPFYEKYICPRLSKPPYVCNGCPERNKCSPEKHLYQDAYVKKGYEMVSKSISRIFCDDLQTEKVKNILYGENG